jgi:uncharacterized protein
LSLRECGKCKGGFSTKLHGAWREASGRFSPTEASDSDKDSVCFSSTSQNGDFKFPIFSFISPGLRIMEWLGHAKTTFTHSPTTLTLNKKDGSSTGLLTICEESTPPCRLNPFLFNGHIQTMLTAVKVDGPPIYYKRKLFEAENSDYEGSFAVDFVVKKYSESDSTLPIRTTYFKDEEFDGIASLDTRPMLIVLHGLSGGSYEIYLKHVIEPLVDAEGDRQWEACVINSRGCAKHKITSSVLYNARATWDCRQMVKWLRQKFPNRPLFGIGFSLGANILTNVSRIQVSEADCSTSFETICDELVLESLLLISTY